MHIIIPTVIQITYYHVLVWIVFNI